MDFVDYLEQLAHARGLSLRQFARAAGTHSGVLSDIRAGRRPPPLRALDRWADALGLTGEQREEFLDLAHLAAATPRVRALVARLRARL